jgi:hypothetical protein
MVQKHLVILGIASIGIFASGCGSKPTGPDQTLVVPAGWTIEDHPPGDLHYSRWVLRSPESTLVEITSFVSAGAPEETLKKMGVWREYMEESTKYAQFVTRGWTAGKYNAVRFFAYASPNDTNHGTVSVWLINEKREFALAISNPSMTRVPLMKLADQFAEDLAKANEK